MDDQQGNVIDGTERARQWRRSRSKAAPENPGDGQGRSDAPKSIAASLLVPADMLEATLVVADEASVAAKAPSRDEEGEGPARPPANTEQRVNPFLLPDAAAPSAQAPPGSSPDSIVNPVARLAAYDRDCVRARVPFLPGSVSGLIAGRRPGARACDFGWPRLAVRRSS